MAIVTRTVTVTVNAAFLQEIKDDSVALKSILESLRRLCGKPLERYAECAQFVNLLGDLRDQLALHFTLEEAYGYFEDAIAQAPRFSERAETLRTQHGELFSELCCLAEEGEDCLCPASATHHVPRRLLQRFRRFDRQFRTHEAAENELILDAFDEDLGVGD